MKIVEELRKASIFSSGQVSGGIGFKDPGFGSENYYLVVPALMPPECGTGVKVLAEQPGRLEPRRNKGSTALSLLC